MEHTLDLILLFFNKNLMCVISKFLQYVILCVLTHKSIWSYFSITMFDSLFSSYTENIYAGYINLVGVCAILSELLRLNIFYRVI